METNERVEARATEQHQSHCMFLASGSSNKIQHIAATKDFPSQFGRSFVVERALSGIYFFRYNGCTERQGEHRDGFENGK